MREPGAVMTRWAEMLGLLVLSLLAGCGSESDYHRKNGKWHYEGVPIDREAEPVGFQPLDRYYAKDDRTAYYRGSRIYHGNEPSDGATFQVLNTWYAKDRNRVYYCDTERDSREYWTVRRTVIKTIAGADAASFRLLADGYTARDQRHLYRNSIALPVRDLESYEPLEHGFAKDKITGYYRDTEVARSDGATFTVMDGHYAKDRANVYFVRGYTVGASLKGVRPDTFRVVGDGYATDGIRAYYRGSVIAAEDGASLQYLEVMGYAKTRHKVFHDGEPMPDADPESFAPAAKFDAAYDATDKSGRFSAGQRVPGVPR